MSVIGAQIKKYRIEKNITQEQLGQLIGVTTQAVSRWERGGTPDAELLPLIASELDVSVDALFGREEQSMTQLLARRLSSMPQKEAYRYAFNICWAIEIGLLGDPASLDDFANRFLERPVVDGDKKHDNFAKIIHDSGMALARVSPGFYHFFLMAEPQGSVLEQLEPPESLRRVFALFADEKLLRIIIFFYSLPDMPIATSLISKKLGIPEKETDRCMEKLCKNNLFIRSVVATSDGEINAYSFRKESFAVPLLCFADEVAKKSDHPFLGNFKRSKPLL